jgi:16S rRNA processing protein RimM
MLQKYLECGQIVRAHGINGAMVVNHFCDSSEIFESLKFVYLKEGNEYKKTKVLRSVPYKSGVLVTLEGITTPEQVVTLRMKYLYADRDDIATGENDFFIVDLIGLDVKDAKTGQLYGKLKDVINQGAQDIYVIERENAPDGYIPAIKEFVTEISLDNGILITPIEGLLD